MLCYNIQVTFTTSRKKSANRSAAKEVFILLVKIYRNRKNVEVLALVVNSI
jgi:hypothetical protein